MRRAKIVATIGPASDSEHTLRELMLSGLDVARINMSHGEREHHGQVIALIRSVAEDLNRTVAIMLDLSGPKIRTGKFREGHVSLDEGSEVTITSEELLGNAACFSTNYHELSDGVRSGDRILIDDGQIELQVIGTTSGKVSARVIHGGVLSDHKGINLPGVQVSIPSITDKDLDDLRFGIAQGVDLVAQSFVRNAADCRRARELIEQLGAGPRLIAKIEKPEAVEDFANILEIVDGVMIARGDLAVETSPERVPVLQKQIIRRCLQVQKLTITATQMLQSMIENPIPTRAEASDVANAILDGSDAVMLSGETAVGRFPIEAVRMMNRIICSTEEMDIPARDIVQRTAFAQRTGVAARAVAEAAVLAVDEAQCDSIVVITQSGNMGRRVAALRPAQRIIALTGNKQTQRQLAVTWGVSPYALRNEGSIDDGLLALADRALLEQNLAKQGEMVVILAGRVPDLVLSLSVKLHRVGDTAADQQ